MPRRAKIARLHWRERSDGYRSIWEIRDGPTRLSTGTDSRREAEAALADYIGRKHRPDAPVGPDELSISMCLTIYADEHAAYVTSPATIGYAISALDAYWRTQPVSAITTETCRGYVRARKTRFGMPASHGTSRRELGVLQAALNFCHKTGRLTSPPEVTLPPKPNSKERWLTRQEAAWLLRGARNLRVNGQHLPDFILHGLYTGSRKATILAMQLNTPSLSGGYVDTLTGVLYRKPQGKVETAKRQRPARLPPRYLAHLRRQARSGRKYIVEDYRGNRVANITNSWASALVLAQQLALQRGIRLDLAGVTPHTLKHTAITWALQKGATIWDAAGYFSTSIQMIESVYGHHSPDHQKTAVEALDRRR